MAAKQYLTERKNYNGNHPFKGTLSLYFNNKKKLPHLQSRQFQDLTVEL